MKLHTINTGFFKLDGGAMFGVVPKTIWQHINPPDEHNLCTWAMRCLLVETANRLVLIDTGIGNKQSDKFFSYYQPHGEITLQQSLEKAGFSVSDITDVLITHLHFDHVGGAVVNTPSGLAPAFPNAVYWSNKAHWQWAMQPNEREKASFLKENILPIQESGHLKYTKEGEELFPGFSIMYSSGHTDAMMHPHIKYKEKTIVYMADLLPTTGHIPLPYVMGYDTRPLITLEEKEKFMNTAAEQEYILFLEHDSIHECCTVEKTEKGVRLKSTFALSEYF